MTPVDAVRGHLRVGARDVPLISGEVQFWRMDPDDWPRALDGVAELGVPIVSTYLSWRRHEPTRGQVDLQGTSDPRLNVPRFLSLAADRDQLVQLKPGPWICAEEPGGGYPDWLLAEPDILALDHAGRYVLGYNPPFQHHVPSYHHPRYLELVTRWLAAVWDEVGSWRHPSGPIIAAQLDNEPSVCFQDSLYGADYHPCAVDAFRDWLMRQYPSPAELARAWAQPGLTSWAAAEPPRPDEPGNPTRLRDWTRFHEWSTAEHLSMLQSVHHRLGAADLLFTVNLNTHPIHDVPQSHAVIRARTAASSGEDHYYVPPLAVDAISRLALSAATARAAGEPLAWSPELQSGIWRSPGEVVDYPDPDLAEQEAWWGAALAVGFSGFNLYMLVDRENWEFAPIASDGTPRDAAARVRRIVRLLTENPELTAAQPATTVTVAWHRPDAYQAYAATGTAWQPDVPWGNPADPAAYRQWLDTVTTLTRGGHLYDLWDTNEPLPPAVRTLIIPPESSIPPALVAAAADSGVHVLHACDLLDQLSAAGIRAPVRTTAADTLTTLSQTDSAAFVHVVHWGEGPPGSVELITSPELRAARLQDLSTGDTVESVDGTFAISSRAGYRVLAVHR
jgi:hypothetical protein